MRNATRENKRNSSHPWSPEELSVLKRLNTPAKIQHFLDTIAYNPLHEIRSPQKVLQERKAHCCEGALFAAACLQRLNFAPLIVDLRATHDDDHVIAVYKINNYWGALAKSNFTTLRSRDPIYRSIRELALSYFDFYFNSKGKKTLHEYSGPFNLNRFKGWQTTTADLHYISQALDDAKHFPFVPKKNKKELIPASLLMIRAGLLGANPKGLDNSWKKFTK